MDTFLTTADGARIRTPAPALPPTFSRSMRGPASAEATFPATLQDAFALRNRSGLSLLEIRDGGELLWRGRVEKRIVSGAGFTVGAFGLGRAFSDVPYTAFWSKATSADFKEVTEDELATSTPARYSMDVNNRVYIAQQKDAASGNDARGVMGFRLPHLGERDAATISVDYDIVATGGLEYALRVNGYRENGGFVNGNSVTTTTSATGTLSHTFGDSIQWVQIHWHRNNATASTYTGETGEAARAIVTNIRIKSTTAATVTASDIASALYDYVAAANPGQLAGKLIDVTTADLREEEYNDERPFAILDRLALASAYNWRVDNRGLFVWQPNSDPAPRRWVATIDLDTFELEEDLGSLYNSAYAVYGDGSNRTLRTATANNTIDVERAGTTRREAVAARTSSDAQAVLFRDAYLQDAGARAIRSSVDVIRLRDEGGGQRPLYAPQPGDIITIANLPATLSPGIDAIRVFRLGYLEYSGSSGRARYEPLTPPATLATLIAQRQAGL